MKAVIQRVSQASVSINQKTTAKIGPGFLVLLGVGENDTEKDVDYLVKKIANLRIMPDQKDKMNLSLKDTNGEILIISQFTLYADTKKGNRPSFIQAAEPQKAEKLYRLFIQKTKQEGINVKSGRFAAMMDISLVNSGPVTIIISSKNP
jgi:D-tyrosyl-tRNA(Tyr) deacylase